MNLNRILLSVVIGGIAGGIAWFNSPAGLTEGPLFDRYSDAGILVLLNEHGFSGVFSVLPKLQYALLSFVGVGLASLVMIRMLGDVLVDIYKIPELRNRILTSDHEQTGIAGCFSFRVFRLPAGYRYRQLRKTDGKR